MCVILAAAGWTELDEREPWAGKLKPGGKYFYTRNRSCLVAVAVGARYEPGHGFKVIGAHTDSPNLRVKPRSKRSGSGCIQLDVECYGGGLWHTWFDRDLSVSGRVLLRGSDGAVKQTLVKVNRPVLRVPTLCIHLQTAEEREAFKVNKEEHLQPILAIAQQMLSVAAATGDVDPPVDTKEADADGESGGEKDESGDENPDWATSQEPLLVQMLAAELGVDAEDILDFECSLYDTQPASLGGAQSEFIYSSRLDNLASCFVAVEALMGHAEANLDTDSEVSVAALFDHEEVGSSSSSGAGSPIMGEAVRRISTALNAGQGNEDLYASALHRSFVMSADMAHAVHPNYAAKHEKTHGPLMNRGIVIKSNGNQRYASNGITSFVVRELARRAELPPPQEFVVRNDCPCGSTIGPIIAASTGIRAVDVGMPQLSMHSVREMMGVADLTIAVKMFRTFFKDFKTIDENLR
mmetsp:Transcript_11930/g.26944  ORF Transcript_11930/g.26944 Transcript_11930/m.26944 type:complete len:466 (+) Transcript_11930:2-1399(+)